jgi:hypothetical protein
LKRKGCFEAMGLIECGRGSISQPATTAAAAAARRKTRKSRLVFFRALSLMEKLSTKLHHHTHTHTLVLALLLLLLLLLLSLLLAV